MSTSLSVFTNALQIEMTKSQQIISLILKLKKGLIVLPNGLKRGLN